MTGGFSLADAYSKAKDVLAGDALPAAEYDLRVKTAREKTTQGGKVAIALTLEVVGGPLAGRTVRDQFTWSPESDVAMRIFHQSLSVLGATQDWIMSNQPTMTQITEKITGVTVRAQLTTEVWNEQERNKIRYLRRLNATEAGPAVPSLDGNGNGASSTSTDGDDDTPWAL